MEFFEVDLRPIPKGSRGAAESLYEQIRAAILDGRLAAGTKLPPTRKSAPYFGVSRNTAAEVYDRLLGEGLVITRHGSGTYVADAIAKSILRKSTRSVPAIDRRLNDFWLRQDTSQAIGFWRERMSDQPARGPGHAVDFRPALVDSMLFPFDTFRQVSVKQLRRLERKPAQYKSPQGNQGNFGLRDAIRKHISLTRAVACRPEDIVITSGAQQAFDLLARVLVKRDQTIVAIEDPGYPPMRVAFAAAGAKVVPVGIDDEGLIVENLPSGVGVICVCPSHQFPLGVTMSRRRRQALIEFARSRGAVIVEDDYDGEFRYESSPLQALRSSEEADLVFYVGTFSKCMLPNLRLGYIVASDWALPSLVAAKNCLDWHCPTPIQLSVAAFMAEGHLRRHVRKMRSLYAARRRLILSTLQRDFAEWLVPVPSVYGMHLTAVARQSGDLDAMADDLLKHHVCIHTLSRYYLGQETVSGLIFGFGAADLAQLKRGLAAVRKSLVR